MGKLAISLSPKIKMTLRTVSGIATPPHVIHSWPPPISTGACSSSVPRRRTAAQAISAHITTVATMNTIVMASDSWAIRCAAGPCALNVDCTASHPVRNGNPKLKSRNLRIVWPQCSDCVPTMMRSLSKGLGVCSLAGSIGGSASCGVRMDLM